MLALLPLLAAPAAARIPAHFGHVRRGQEQMFMHLPGFDALATPTSYATGEVHMVAMNRMRADVDELLADPRFPTLATEPVLHPVPCVDGYATTGNENATYACSGLDMRSFLPHAMMGSNISVGNDIWGWVSPDGREFALVGQFDGTALVEILPGGEPVYVGRIPTTPVEDEGHYNIWRDIKVIDDYAYVGSEIDGHGIQAFDLKKLLDVSLHSSPKTFSVDTDLASLYKSFATGGSHNIVAHEEKKLIVAVGSRPRTDKCGSGLIFIDVSDPTNPKDAGCAAEDGYTHDAQCLTYRGPDKRYDGRDVCYAYNENTLAIWDITDTHNATILSNTYYYGVAYSHQGWVTDVNDQRWLLLDDELDEMMERGWAVGQHTVTYLWDIQDLENPVLTGHWNSPAKAIDHNLYVRDGLAYLSNYQSGLRIIDVSSLDEDPTGGKVSEKAFFDVHPEDDEVGGEAVFGGVWSTYPYFPSGNIVVNSMERGLFVLKFSD